MRLRGSVQVMRLAQRFGDHAASVRAGVHPPDRAGQIIGCDRKQTRIRLLGSLGIDARFRWLVGKEDSVRRILSPTMCSRRQAHRRGDRARHFAGKSIHRDRLVKHLDHVEVAGEMLERRQVPEECRNENDRDLDTVVTKLLNPHDAVGVRKQTIDDEQ